ncbi:MAG: hypothetical protein ABSD88_19705 [Candidatus Korobacteraceae bacterium]|jgi:hypothetical protein
MPRFSLSDIIGVAGIVLAVVLVVLDKAGKLKGHWLFILLAVAAFMTLFIAIGNPWVMDAPLRWKIWRGMLMFCIVVLTYSGIALWISPVTQTAKEPAPPPAIKKTPSFLFVFGAPLGDNHSATWIMMLLHYGPESAYNCNVDFYDDDRKNIEHLWLVEHPNTPFLPPARFDESQKRLYVAEAGPEGGTRNNFTWTPINPNSQHYTVSISCRDGVFTEKWEAARVDGVLRAKIVIERGPEWVRKNPQESPLVFKCEDPEFVSTALATAFPVQRSGVITHPGWKPDYRVEVPMAIIDPNGNVQVASGIKQPDGSTRTDFGCWNILSKHFGGNPN